MKKKQVKERRSVTENQRRLTSQATLPTYILCFLLSFFSPSSFSALPFSAETHSRACPVLESSRTRITLEQSLTASVLVRLACLRQFRHGRTDGRTPCALSLSLARPQKPRGLAFPDARYRCRLASRAQPLPLPLTCQCCCTVHMAGCVYVGRSARRHTLRQRRPGRTQQQCNRAPAGGQPAPCTGGWHGYLGVASRGAATAPDGRALT